MSRTGKMMSGRYMPMSGLEMPKYDTKAEAEAAAQREAEPIYDHNIHQKRPKKVSK